jgi:hypothetical protein
LNAAEGQHEVESNAVLVVRAVNAATSRPLASVRVQLSVKHPPDNTWVSVSVPAQKGSLHASPLTAKDGQVEFRAPSGIALVVDAAGEAGEIATATCDVIPLQPGEHRTVTIPLHVGADIAFFGRVLDVDGQTPVADAMITVFPGGRDNESVEEASSSADPEVLARAKSDETGRFEVRAGSWKHPCLRAQARGHGMAVARVTGENHSRDTEAILVLRASASIEVLVTDAGGKGLKGRQVSASVDGCRLSDDEETAYTRLIVPRVVSWTAITDSDGQCTLADVPSGMPFRVAVYEHSLGERREGEFPALEPHEVRRLRFTTGGGATISGGLRNLAGEAVSDRDVWLLRALENKLFTATAVDESAVIATAKTKLNGHFEFQDVSAGFYWLALPDKYELPEKTEREWVIGYGVDLEVRPGSDTQYVSFTVPTEVFIRGRALDASGSPVGNAQIRAILEESWPSLATTTDERGTFKIGPFKEREPVRLEASTGESGDQCGSLTAQAGDDEVVLMVVGSGHIEGIAMDGASGSRSPAFGYVAEHGVWFGPAQSLSASDDGSFRTLGLAPGVYDIALSTPDGRYGVLRGIHVGSGEATTGQVVTLAPQPKLRIHYHGEARLCVFRIVHAGALVATDVVEPHSTYVQSVPPGKLTVRLYPGFMPWLEREVDVSAGETSDVEFDDGK